MPTPVNRELLRGQLKRDEGTELKLYVDTVGKASIGTGRNLTDKGITPREADMMLDNDIDEAVAALDVNLPWWADLDEPRRRVLVNMAFNMGINTLLTFRHTLDLISHGQYAAAANAMMDSRWADQVGKRANRLAETMRTGVDDAV